MKSIKSWSMLVVLSLLIGALAPMAMPASSSADWSKVDPRVLDQIAVNGETGFLTILSLQADVSGAAALETKVEKTTYVFNLLRDTAAQTQPPLLAYLDAQGIDYQAHYIQNAVHVKAAGQAAVQWLASRPEVARIVPPPQAELEPVDRSAGSTEQVSAVEWNITRVHAPEVWAMGIHGEGSVVAGNDTGVDYTHPALVDKYRGNLGGGSFDHNYNWWDGASGYQFPHDYDGHGTHTMGTMVGDDGAGNQVGMAPGAQWIACAGLGGTDPYNCFEFFLTPWNLQGLNPDPSKAPDAINNSWYDPSGFDYRPIIVNLNAAGVAVIKSAGNTGPSCSTISNPGSVPEIIATAAFAQGDTIASFSARGPMSDYGDTIVKPEVAAPGVNVRSSVPGGGYEGGWEGTSMAAPHSTGLVALIWSAAPCIRGDVPLTKQIMMETAEAKIDAQCPPFVDHPNDVWGWGVLDAQAAVQYAMGICGGMGGLDGTVSSGGSPLEGVVVSAAGLGGFGRTDTTDVTGFYAMEVLSDTYTLTATKYGYEPAIVPGVEVTSGMTTTVDIELAALPEYTVSGTVREAGTNAPLAAVVEFLDAPVPPVNTDPATGFYSIQVAEGTWQLKATAAQHLPQIVDVVVTANVSQDFSLDPLPCVLVVDDDQNGPDVRDFYTAALDDLGLSYNVWDVATDGDPAAADLMGYNLIIWFNGFPYSSTFTGANEAAVAAYLDAGGRFFLSGQDYLYDAGLTTFGQNYLHIASFTSDVNQTTVTGQNVFAGLGPYTLSYPFTNYSDTVNPDAQAQVAFGGNVGNAAVSFDGATFQTVFFGYPFEALPAAGRTAVMERIVDFFGDCACAPVQIVSTDAQVDGCTATFGATLEGDPPVIYAWEFGAFGTSPDAAPVIDFELTGTYPYTLSVSNCAGMATDVATGTVSVECAPPCDEVMGVSLSLLTLPPIYPGDDVALLADVENDGATAPFTYTVDGGPAMMATAEPFTVTLAYAEAGTHTVEIALWNCAMTDPVTATESVFVAPMYYIYLPVVARTEGPGR